MIEFNAIPDESKKTALPVIDSSPKPSITPSLNSRPPSRKSLQAYSVGRPTKFSWVLAKEITLLAQKDYLINIVQLPDMPTIQTINLWMLKYTKFNQWIQRARTLFADYLAEKSAQLFDESPPMEVIATKNGTYERISMSGVQRERYKSQAMFNLASKFNQERYGEKVNINNTFDLAEVLRIVNGPGKKAKPAIDVPTVSKPLNQ